MSTHDHAAGQPLVSPVFGPLSWDARFGCWNGQVALAGGPPAQLTITPRDGAGAAESLAVAEALAGWLGAHEADARAYAAAQLLELHNASWNEADEPTSAQAFQARLSLTNLTVDSDGGAALFYDDGDLFFGHVVIVSLDSARTFYEASIAG